MNRRILKKGWQYFDIMHKDRRVARIYENGKCTVSFPSFMPYNFFLKKENDTDTCVQNLINFYAWCSSRVFPPDRKHAKEIMNNIDPAWFNDNATKEMFLQRLDFLKSIEKK